MARELVLPSWAEKGKQPGIVIAHADQFYPELLAELMSEEDALDQFWLKTARYCAMRDVQLAVAGTDWQAPSGGALQIRIKDSEKAYRLTNHPEGEPATKGAMREHYARIRGGLV